MGDITTTSTFRDCAVGGMAGKMITVETVTTADTGDTFTVTLANYGCSVFQGISGYVHTTENSVVVGEAPTTAVSSGVLTVTVGGSAASNYKRCYVIYMK